MSATLDKSSIVSNDWSGEEKHLRDFVKQFPLPTLGKINRGQYSCVGSGKKLHDVVYIHSIYASQCVIAESHFSGKNPSTFAIPISYVGWFDVLSEDKKPVKPISNANEFSKCNSKLFLVRESIKSIQNLSLETSRKVRELEPGEVLRRSDKQDSSRAKSQLLFQDVNNKHVQLDSTQRFSLSAITNNDEIQGVHSIKDLVEHFSFPTNVQLAYGEFFSSTTYHPIFRLIGTSNIEFSIVIPLKMTSQVLSIPLIEMLMLSPPRDHKSFKGSNEFKEISKFAQTIESHQQKTITLVTVGNLNIHKNKSHKHDELLSKTTNTNHSAYDEIEAIYKFIREGGELSDFDIKDQIDASDKAPETTKVFSPTTPSDALEREIWEEPIYADVSKLKAHQLSKKKNKSGDSELANIGMEQKPGEKQSKMNSSYKKTLQKYRNKANSSLQQNFVELQYANNLQTDQRQSKLVHQQQRTSPIKINELKDIDTTSPPKNTEIRKVDENLNLKPQEQATNTNVKNQPFESQKQFSNNSQIPKDGHLEPAYFINTLDDLTLDRNNNKTDYNKSEIITKESGWNVSVLKDELDEDSKKTRVKINYDQSLNRLEDLETIATDNHDYPLVESSQDKSMLTFKQMPQIGTNTSETNERTVECAFLVDASDEHEARFGENKSVINISSAKSSIIHSNQITTHESPSTSPNPRGNSIFYKHPESEYTLPESPPVFSKNVSTIRLDSRVNNCHYDNKDPIDSSQRFGYGQSVKIICNSSNFGGTVSSRTFLGNDTLRNENIRHQQTLQQASNQANMDLENQGYSGITTIKIDKSGISQQSIEPGNINISDKQVVQKSPYGNTQIYIRQAFPSRATTSASSKLYINKTSF